MCIRDSAEIDQIWDVFQYDLAKTNFYYLHSLLALEEGDWARGVETADAYYDENPEDLLHILALGAKVKAQTELGELAAAEATLGHAAEVVKRSAPVPPFHVSAYHRSRLLLDVTRLEGAEGGGDAEARRIWRGRLRKSVGPALRSGSKVAFRRTEGLRLAGRHQALLGNERRARRLFERALTAGDRVGARPRPTPVGIEVAKRPAVRRQERPDLGPRARGLRPRAEPLAERDGTLEEAVRPPHVSE